MQQQELRHSVHFSDEIFSLQFTITLCNEFKFPDVFFMLYSWLIKKNKKSAISESFLHDKSIGTT